MVCLNHTAAASSEPRCLSLSQTFIMAPCPPEGWLQITVDGLESSHWFGAEIHYEAWRPFTALDSLVFVLSFFKFDLLLCCSRRVQTCTIPACKRGTVTAVGLKLRPLSRNPSLRWNKSNRGAIQDHKWKQLQMFEERCVVWKRCEFHIASVSSFNGIILCEMLWESWMLSTPQEKPRQNGIL